MPHSYYSYDIQWFKLHLAGFNIPRAPSNHKLLKEQQFTTYTTTCRLDLQYRYFRITSGRILSAQGTVMTVGPFGDLRGTVLFWPRVGISTRDQFL